MSASRFHETDGKGKNPSAGKRLAPLVGGSAKAGASTRTASKTAHKSFASSANAGSAHKSVHSAGDKHTMASTAPRRPSTAGDNNALPAAAATVGHRTGGAGTTAGKPRAPVIHRHAATTTTTTGATREAARAEPRRTSGAAAAASSNNASVSAAAAAASPKVGSKKRESVTMVAAAPPMKVAAVLGDRNATGDSGAYSPTKRDALHVSSRQREVSIRESRLPFAPFDLKTEYYRSSSNWNHNLPVTVLEVMEGTALEEPFTTLLWTQAAEDPTKVAVGAREDPTGATAPLKDGKLPMEDPQHHRYNRKITEGYYSCVRCAAPLFDPRNQIDNIPARGMAAFQYINKDAVTVEIVTVVTTAPAAAAAGGGGGAVSKQRQLSMAEGPSSFKFHVHCKYCNAFVATTTRDVPAVLTRVVESGELYTVNSCCLLYMPYRTKANLDGVIAEERDSDGEDDADVDSSEGRLEDDEIFNVQLI